MKRAAMLRTVLAAAQSMGFDAAALQKQKLAPSNVLEAISAGAPEEWWTGLVAQTRANLVGQVLNPSDSILPNGSPAPTFGVAYWIAAPNGIAIFQPDSSPYSPGTVGTSPGPLTETNAAEALEAHMSALAEMLATHELSRLAGDWLAERLL